MPTDYMVINSAIPSYWGWTQYTPVIPKLYWDVYSQEERIKRLCMEYDKLTHYASMIADNVNELSDNMSDIKEWVTAQLTAQNKMVNNKLNEMQSYIEAKLADVAQGTQMYDVTTGEYRPSMESARRLFQALSYDHKGNKQLVSVVANKPVSELSNQTVYNVAYSDLINCVIDDQIMTERNQND